MKTTANRTIFRAKTAGGVRYYETLRFDGRLQHPLSYDDVQRATSFHGYRVVDVVRKPSLDPGRIRYRLRRVATTGGAS